MEDLREMKKEKKHLECHWRSTRNKFNRTWIRVDIKALFVTVRMGKHQYFSMLVVSTGCHPTALFWVTQTLLNKRDSEYYL